ncbi:TetR/AcrR family transcriptional regulator [Jiangella rhizosphaerae]|uniref:TetR family transcriptional regulator n=1 Tax=Jiangella rhizosphaerae TaxID=2293569 RepID=A0A418KIY4_9ACTN|nr:TetR/AcrR family transcriptional regulator C-terminal domain-containing protein [Jiangella rhizosphaerae]RIQ13298.1 TetR family transcriptional regulator [Jiangella rhizosphaerae]
MPSNAPRPSDPTRLISLLWEPSDRPGRSGLSKQAVVENAIAIADAEGLGALTMRRVADRLGVGAMTLYTHVPGKPELVELMLDAVAGEAYADGALPGAQGDWRAGMRHVAERNWGHHLRHPWTVEVVPGRPVLGPGVSAKYEVELAPLDGIGLSDLEMDQVLCGVLALVESTARQQIGLDRVRAGNGDLDWWATVSPVLAQAMRGRRFPLAERVGAATGEAVEAGDPLATMRLSLDLLLDGVAGRLA